MKPFISYYRVSTESQGRSGLGLDAQRAALTGYVAGSRDRERQAQRPLSWSSGLAACRRQRADYTHKFNSRDAHKSSRHGWLRLTPAYSVKVVDELLAAFPSAPAHSFDPFCETATTALCATTKTATYSAAMIQVTRVPKPSPL